MNEAASNGSAAVSRAAKLLDRLEDRIETGAQELRERAAAPKAPAAPKVPAAPTETAAASPVNPAAERAGAMLDGAGERLGKLASEISLRARKAAALAREEAEDMLAEAQSIRRGQPS